MYDDSAPTAIRALAHCPEHHKLSLNHNSNFRMALLSWSRSSFSGSRPSGTLARSHPASRAICSSTAYHRRSDGNRPVSVPGGSPVKRSEKRFAVQTSAAGTAWAEAPTTPARRKPSLAMVELLKICCKYEVESNDVENAEFALGLGVSPDLDVDQQAVEMASELHYGAGYTALMLAVERGHTELVSLLLAKGADPGLAGKGEQAGMTPLHKAKTGEIIKMLVAAGADVKLAHEVELLVMCDMREPVAPEHVRRAGELLDIGVSPNAASVCTERYGPEGAGYTALMLAACRGHTELVSLLLAKGADPGLAGKGSRTPLHVATSAEIVQVLVAAGADVKATDEDGKTPLHWAESAEVVDVLVAAGADIKSTDKDGWTPLHKAADVGVVRALIGAGADVNARHKADGWTPLQTARTTEVRKVLLESGAGANAADKDGNTLLHRNRKWPGLFLSLEPLSVEDVRLLLQHGADARAVNKSGQSVLSKWAPSCMYSSHWEVVDLLVEAGADINEAQGKIIHSALWNLRQYEYDDDRAVHYAAPVARVRKLRAMGATGLSGEYWNQQEGADTVAAGSADSASDLEALRRGMAGELLALCTTGLPAAAAAAAGGEEAGAPLRQQEAPVGWATALLDRGVSPRVAYGNGQSALHLAAGSGQVQLVELLLQRGADVEARDVLGQTPLFAAASGGHPEVVQLLLQHGADTKAIDKLRNTPLHEVAGWWQGMEAGGDNAQEAEEAARRLGAVMGLLWDKFITDWKQDLNLEDLPEGFNGFNYFHAAAFGGNHVALRWLLDVPRWSDLFGDWNMPWTRKDRTRLTPAGIAVMRGNFMALHLLQQNEADNLEESDDEECESLLGWARAKARRLKSDLQKKVEPEPDAYLGYHSRQDVPLKDLIRELRARQKVVAYLNWKLMDRKSDWERVVAQMRPPATFA